MKRGIDERGRWMIEIKEEGEKEKERGGKKMEKGGIDDEEEEKWNKE